MTVVEERNKNRHPPRIAKNSLDHRRGAVIGEKGDKGSSGSFSRFTGTCIELIDVVNPHNPLSHCGVYWLSSLNHPHVVVRSSSEWLVRSWWYAHRIYMRIWFPRQTCILTDSCFWPKCCGSDSWDSLPYAVNSQRTTLYQCLTEEYLLACARNFHRTACWRRLGIVLQKLTPLKTLLGKDSVPYAGSFCGCLLKKAEYLVREIIHISYWGR